MDSEYQVAKCSKKKMNVILVFRTGLWANISIYYLAIDLRVSVE